MLERQKAIFSGRVSESALDNDSIKSSDKGSQTLAQTAALALVI